MVIHNNINDGDTPKKEGEAMPALITKEELSRRTTLGSASEGEIRELVGHTDSRIIERYRHLSQEDARRKMNKIDLLGTADDTMPTDAT